MVPLHCRSCNVSNTYLALYSELIIIRSKLYASMVFSNLKYGYLVIYTLDVPLRIYILDIQN